MESTESQVLDAGSSRRCHKRLHEKEGKDYSFYTKEEADKVVKKTTREYKDTLKEKRTLCQAWR